MSSGNHESGKHALILLRHPIKFTQTHQPLRKESKDYEITNLGHIEVKPAFMKDTMIVWIVLSSK